jgi:hypothetical protein
MQKAKAKKIAYVVFMLSIIGATYAIGKYDLGCEIKGSLIMCGSKTSRLEGCYVENING